MSKQKVKLSFNAYAIIERAIEEGLPLGYRRAHKHISKPCEKFIFEKQCDAIVELLCEVINFDA